MCFRLVDPFSGYKYVPKSSILYIETGEIVEEDSMGRMLRKLDY